MPENDEPTNPGTPAPSSADTIADLGTEPISSFQKAIDEAASELKGQLNKEDVRKEIITGVFAFLRTAIPVAGPVLKGIETVLLSLAHIGAK